MKEKLNNKESSNLIEAKIVVRLHNFSRVYRKFNNLLSTKDKKIMEMEKYTIENCDIIISSCVSTVKAFKEAMDLENLPVAYVPNSVDSSYFIPGNKDCIDKPFIFGYVGRITKEKGIDTLIKAFKNIAESKSNVRLQLIGKRNKYMYSLLKDLPESIKKKIILTGHIHRSDLLRYYQNFDVFILPSRCDSFPNVLLEAMSCGLPIISSDVGGVKELLGVDNPSLLFKAEDIFGLKNEMYEMLNDQKLRLEASIYNRKRVEENFMREKVSKKYIEVYNDLVNAE